MLTFLFRVREKKKKTWNIIFVITYSYFENFLFFFFSWSNRYTKTTQKVSITWTGQTKTCYDVKNECYIIYIIYISSKRTGHRKLTTDEWWVIVVGFAQTLETMTNHCFSKRFRLQCINVFTLEVLVKILIVCRLVRN